MKLVKVLLINILVFAILIISIEIFTSFKLKIKKVKEPRSFNNFIPIKDKIPLEYKTRIKIEELNKLTNQESVMEAPINRQWIKTNEGLMSSLFTKVVKSSGQIIFQANYVKENLLHRYVSNQNKKVNTSNFVLSAGDSFTFGEGSDQGMDYPSILANFLDKNWKIYNYGINGDGPNDFYMRNQVDINYLNRIKEKNGVFIWVYIDAQMSRLIYPTTIKKNLQTFILKPDLTLENDEIIFNGDFKDAHRPYRKLIELLRLSNALDYFDIEIPKLMTRENFELFFKLLDSVCKSSTDLNISKKYFVVYQTHADMHMIQEIARKYSFIVIDQEKLNHSRDVKNNGDLNLEIPLDGHPTSEANWLLAKNLSKFLIK